MAYLATDTQVNLLACASSKLIEVDLEHFGYPGEDIYRTRALTGFQFGYVSK